jgi:hypothetical protein
MLLMIYSPAPSGCVSSKVVSRGSERTRNAAGHFDSRIDESLSPASRSKYASLFNAMKIQRTKSRLSDGVLTSPILPGCFKRIPPLSLLSKFLGTNSTMQMTLIPPPPFRVHGGMRQHPLCPAYYLPSFHVAQNSLSDISTSSTPLALGDLQEIPKERTEPD